MALAMWAKSAVGPNIAFLRQLKTWKDVVQQKIWSKAFPTKQVKVVQVQRSKVTDFQPIHEHFLQKTSSFRSRIFRSFFSRTTSRSIISQLRKRTTNRPRLSSAQVKACRNVPLCSLIGVTLGFDSESLISDNRYKVMDEMQDLFSDFSWQAEALPNPPKSLSDLDINLQSLASGCEGAVYKAKVKAAEEIGHGKVTNTDADFDLAVKAIFNYGAASNAETILRELRREYVPLHMTEVPENHMIAERVGRLPPHPNIVDMPGIFEDDVLVTEEGLKKFPAAMPRRLDPERCWGRNKTLYVVMRRRSTHLRDYLSTHEVSMETRCFLLAQLLEGVSHLVQHGIAHRDLKADNILVDIPKDGGVPKLEICDFGCCLAEEDRSLKVDYPCMDIYKGGNSWLMAPEIATAKAGKGSVLDYSRSDLWAAAAIAYEILGGENPFYPSKDGTHKQLSTWSYTDDDLPALPADVPEPVRVCVMAMLSREPSKRPSPSVAATVVHMVNLNEPVTPKKEHDTFSKYVDLRGGSRKTNCVSGRRRVPQAVLLANQEREKFQWVLVQSLALLCQLRFGRDKAEVWDVPSVMRFLFLSRLTYADFREALVYF